MDEMEEKRMAEQTQYDPKVHGAGTIELQEPGSVKEMWGQVKSLMVRVEMLEASLKKKASAFGKSE